MGFSCTTLWCWGVFPLPLVEGFINKGFCTMSIFFCTYWEGHIIRILSLINAMYYIGLFVTFEPPLQPRNKSHLVTLKDPFNILLGSICKYFLSFFFNVYLFLRQRETEHERGRGRERGRHRIGNRLQALSHQPRAQREARTHGLRDRDLAEVGRLTDCATQAPLILCFKT